MPDEPREGVHEATTIYGGRYEIVRRIARGGMAEVFLARDKLLDRRVALKVLFPELSTDRSFVERFRREAQAAANLTHPHIVSVFDWGEEDGTYFIVMEYIDGRPLSQLLRAEGPLLPDRAASIGADVAAALAAAHRGGVVHRDVKPGNVLIDSQGNVKVTDFGIARALNTQDDLTQTGAVMGTATYFSPEQAQGFSVDARSDVYSLGVVLYEMVTGRPPFSGDTPVAIAYKHVRERVEPPRRVNPAVPAAFEAVVMQCLAKDPADRYAGADELRADLLRFRQGRNVLAAPPAPPTEAVAATRVQPAIDRTTAVAPAQAADYPPQTRRTGPYVVLLVGMLAVLGVLLFLLGREFGLFGGSSTTVNVAVPNVVGKPADDAQRDLEALGFRVDRRVENSTEPADTVFAQDPEAGTKVPRDALVTLKVSEGPAPVDIPKVIGLDQAEAEARLKNAGFDVDVVNRADDADPGTVIAQDPSFDDKAASGSTVTITVSSGKDRVAVPDVAGKDSDTAANELGRAGFGVKRKAESSDSVADGKVIRTDPAAGTEAEKGSDVVMVVSTGPEEVTVPNVIGMTEEAARKQLQDLGFKVVVEDFTTNNPSDVGRVVEQSPTGGTKLRKGATVTIRVGRQLTP